MKTFAKLLMLLLFALNAQAASAQAWTSGARPVNWVSSPVVGDGVDRIAEVSTSTQGGDPPALASEPAAIDENGLYTRSAWLYASAVDRIVGAGSKFRTQCNHSHFLQADPILYHGQANAGHLHDFIGNAGTDQNSTYTSLRNSPKSTCGGGPLNATGYWEPALMFEVDDGIFVPVKPNIVTFYYTIVESYVPTLYRLPRGLAFIGGVDPNDRLNVARLAEIPNGAGWLKTKRYNGWSGWACFNGGTIVPLAADNTADVETANYARQLVNADGTDPWGGACEGADKILIANMVSPSCWDGYNLASPNGRDHFRYPILKSSNQSPDAAKCPDGWWKVPHFEVKTQFNNGRAGGLSGHAYRSKLHLSSDRMDPNPANWHPRGSTFHFDWMGGWDYNIMSTWMQQCVGLTINGVAGEKAVCGSSTLGPTSTMKDQAAASPDPTLSNDPITSIYTYYDDPAKDAFGPVTTGTVVDAHVEHAF